MKPHSITLSYNPYTEVYTLRIERWASSAYTFTHADLFKIVLPTSVRADARAFGNVRLELRED
jgi:hypothetical protein